MLVFGDNLDIFGTLIARGLFFARKVSAIGEGGGGYFENGVDIRTLILNDK